MTLTKSSSLTSTPWLSRLTNRVGQLRSRLDFEDLQEPQTVEDRLLRAVLRQMLDRPLSLIGRGVNSAELDRLERGLRSKAFRRFGGEAGLVRFALNESIRPDRSELTDVLVDSALQALVDPAADHCDVVRTIGQAYFEAVCDDPCLTFQTFAWLGAREDPSLRKSFIALYESLGSRLAEGLEPFLADWGRKPRAEYSTTEIATVLTSLVEGLAMRTAVDPDAVSNDLAAEAALMVVLGFSEAAA